ncbi:unnamed protein product [Orchesella dallaii]|uniref:Uncharacterized protein n=1 Tax=Orchesella dallaii TaxID=48710 RepID=A0ABP1QYY7_9HEXA
MSNPLNSQRSGGSPRSSGHHHSPHRGNERPMKWINPCRIPTSIPTQPSEIHMPIQSDEEIFQNIVTQARKAEVQARRFFEDFRDECFGKSGHDFQQLHYDWLKDVAEKVDKTLGEPVAQERLDSLEVEDILKSMYRGLQKLAVGLEQVVLDQAIHGGSFYQHFHEAEFQLKYVLCEFQIAMMEKNIQYEDVTREIMDKHFVKLDDKTWRNLRDFSIFRDYLNTLEFIRESFQHFWKRSKDTS